MHKNTITLTRTASPRGHPEGPALQRLRGRSCSSAQGLVESELHSGEKNRFEVEPSHDGLRTCVVFKVIMVFPTSAARVGFTNVNSKLDEKHKIIIEHPHDVVVLMLMLMLVLCCVRVVLK